MEWESSKSNKNMNLEWNGQEGGEKRIKDYSMKVNGEGQV